MSSSNRLGQHHRNVNELNTSKLFPLISSSLHLFELYLDLGALFHLLLLWYRVGHDDSIEIRVVYFTYGISAEYTMRANRVHFFSAGFLKLEAVLKS